LLVITDANKLEAVDSRDDSERYDEQNTQHSIAIALFSCGERIGQLYSLASPRIDVQSHEGLLLSFQKEKRLSHHSRSRIERVEGSFSR
jgi:hypothetical protein